MLVQLWMWIGLLVCSEVMLKDMVIWWLLCVQILLLLNVLFSMMMLFGVGLVFMFRVFRLLVMIWIWFDFLICSFLVLCRIVCFLVQVVVMKSIGNLLMVSGIRFLGMLMFLSCVECMWMLVIGLLLILCWFFRFRLLFIRCRILMMLMCVGLMLMCCRISFEFLVILVVIRKKVVEEMLVGILIWVVFNLCLDLILVVLFLIIIGQLKLCSMCLVWLWVGVGLVIEVLFMVQSLVSNRQDFIWVLVIGML